MRTNEDPAIEAAEPPTCNVVPAPDSSDAGYTGFITTPDAEAKVRESPPPLAIVGMAARLPGGVNSIPDMYEFLRDKKDGSGEVPASRFNVDGFYSQGEVSYSMRTRKAYFLNDDIATVDASFFGASEMEVSGADPRARLLLEVVYECLENAGETDYRGKDIGCYVGAWGVDWCELTLKDGQQRNPLLGAAAGSFFISSYIAWNLDLHGPRYVPPGISPTFLAGKRLSSWLA
jgi:acyl transferase domain-containing protein